MNYYTQEFTERDIRELVVIAAYIADADRLGKSVNLDSFTDEYVSLIHKASASTEVITRTRIGFMERIKVHMTIKDYGNKDMNPVMKIVDAWANEKVKSIRRNSRRWDHLMSHLQD